MSGKSPKLAAERPTSAVSRRSLLGGAAAVGLLGLPVVADDSETSKGGECVAAPRTSRGPFYPESAIPEAFDLTRIEGRGGPPAGQLLYLHGQVTDERCAPVEGARVEIWQADARGVYRHPRADDQANLDPSFRYFAYVRADRAGRYRFKTIVPSHYRHLDRERAPHIHFRVAARGYSDLVTEMYFAGTVDDERRRGDGVWLALSEERRNLIVTKQSPELHPELGEVEDGAVCCRFDLRLAG